MAGVEGASDPAADLPFRELAKHLPTPCWISDAEGVIVWVNDAWLAYTGKDPAALAAEGLAVLHDPEVYPAVQQRWAATKAAGRADQMEFPLRGRDGGLRPFLTRVVPLHDASGRVVRWFGTNTDISEQSEAEARIRHTEESLRESEARLRLATEAGGVGVWERRIPSNEMHYSSRAKAIFGFVEDAPVSQAQILAAIHPEDLERTVAQGARATDPAIRDRTPYEYRIVRPGGEVRWVEAFGEAVFEPGPDGELQATRHVGSMIDITERKRAENAVRDSARRLHLALKAGRMAVWSVDSSGALDASPELNAVVGLPPDGVPTVEMLLAHYMPGEFDRIREAARAARDRGELHFEVEYRFGRPDGEVRWHNARAEARVAADGRPDGIIGVVMDVTERKADEERLRLLAREVDHRANNLMTVVQGMVALSQAASAEELRGVITGRLHALARAHQLLAAARWSGADLRRLVQEELAPFSLGEAGRVRTAGPDVALSPQAAQGLAMVLHELTTNAAKHGALGAAGGSVEVAWTVQDSRLTLNWVERDGPPTAEPTRKGFGASVIGRALGGALGGETRLEWRPEGLVCTLELPVEDANPGQTSDDVVIMRHETR